MERELYAGLAAIAFALSTSGCATGPSENIVDQLRNGQAPEPIYSRSDLEYKARDDSHPPVNTVVIYKIPLGSK